jgi:tRNA threonylcarbamoyladenosine biosynthesis protein TsaB
MRHIDLYRLDPREVRDLDWRELFYGPGVAVVEWAERAEDTLPGRRYQVSIDHAGQDDPATRVLTISGPAAGGATPRPEVRVEPAPSAARRRRTLHAQPEPGAPSRVLAIDTSTSSRSLAVLAESRIIEDNWGPGEGELLAENIADSLKDILGAAGLSARDLELIAVTRGPGSFTGIKVGMASAKSLAYALDIPLRGVSTLDVLAVAALRFAPAAMTLIDARREEVFGAAYAGTPTPLPLGASNAEERYLAGPACDVARVLLRALREAGVVTPGSGITLAGSGATLHGDDIAAEVTQAKTGPAPSAGETAGETAGLFVPGPEHPRAADLILLALARHAPGPGREDPMALAPLYLREPGITPPARSRALEGDPD